MSSGYFYTLNNSDTSLTLVTSHWHCCCCQPEGMCHTAKFVAAEAMAQSSIESETQAKAFMGSISIAVLIPNNPATVSET